MKQLSRQCLQGNGDEPKHTGSAVLMRTSVSPEDEGLFAYVELLICVGAELSILTCEDPREKEQVRLLWAGAGLDG